MFLYRERKFHTIREAMLDELKKETAFDVNTTHMDNEVLEELVKVAETVDFEWSEAVDKAFEQLTEAERKLVHWLFVEELSLFECAKRVSTSLPGIKKHRQKMMVKLREILVK